MKNPSHIFLAIFVLFLFACKNNETQPSPFAHVKDGKVKDILEKSIARAGGWENYQKMDSIIYKKRTVLYDINGEMESDITQFHAYQLKPYLAMSISWEKEGDQHEIIYKKNKARKLINKKIAEADEEALKKTCMAAYYVLFMPFKLMDPGVELSYKGAVSLPHSKNVYAVAANYDTGKNTNHSTNDQWEYYFDKSNYDFTANMVDHGDYFALIYNSEFVEAGGLRFNAYRPSYRVDNERQHLWQRGEFFYSDFIVK
ncbi:MAG: hypothetical protein AAFZ15_03050 [Bacteroidota bacterium]